MNVLETLLNRRWILKSRDRELYYQVRDELDSVKKFLTEKVGYQVIVNPYLIRVEKIPAKARPWMGIRQFQDPLQYVFLCLILSFLEVREAGDQFVLSQLTDFVQAQCREVQIDWTSYTHRRHLIRVLKFCVSEGMLEIDDGTEDSFMRSETGEVLYRNTGASRYFMRNFTRDIMEYRGMEDFESDEWIDVNTDRGVARRQRVYRRLLMNVGVYRTSEADEDFNYIRNYQGRISDELEALLGCELQVHRGSAYLVEGESASLGHCFPEEKTVGDIVLLCCALVREKVESGTWQLQTDESILISRAELTGLLEECRRRYGAGFVKTYRDMTPGEFCEAVQDYLEELDFIDLDGGDGPVARSLTGREPDQVRIFPVVGKVLGQYPVDYNGEEETEE